MSNYPNGALNNPDAPYNQKENMIEINVLVSLTLSKNFTIKVDKNYDKSTLINQVDTTIFFPNEIIQNEQSFLEGNYSKQELDNWTVVDLDVIEDE